MNEYRSQNLGTWLLLILLAIIWGSSYILMKRGLDAYSSWQVAALRLFISGFVLMPVVPRAIKNFPKRLIPYLLVVSFIGSGIPPFLYTLSISKTPSALNGIINTLTPLFVLVIGIAFFGNKAFWVRVLGVFVGLVGCALLITFNADGDLTFSPYALFAVVACACYGTSTNVLKKYLGNIKPIELTSLIYILLTVPGGIILFGITDFWETFNSHPKALPSLGYIAILSTIGTSIAIFIFNIVVQRTSALFAASVTYLMPIVAIFWGVVDGEDLGLFHFVGTALILLGVFLTTRMRETDQA